MAREARVSFGDIETKNPMVGRGGIVIVDRQNRREILTVTYPTIQEAQRLVAVTKSNRQQATQVATEIRLATRVSQPAVATLEQLTTMVALRRSGNLIQSVAGILRQPRQPQTVA